MLQRLNRARPDFVFARTPRNDGGPHVEGEGPVFYWVTTERGTELSRRQVDADGLAYLAMWELTRDLAQQAELRARKGAGSRWHWMDAHARLMAHLDPSWGARVAADYAEVLLRHPLRADEAMAGMDPLDLSAFGID